MLILCVGGRCSTNILKLLKSYKYQRAIAFWFTYHCSGANMLKSHPNTNPVVKGTLSLAVTKTQVTRSNSFIFVG